MAKAKAGKKAAGGGEGRTANVMVIRGCPEWKAWLDSLAATNETPLVVTIDQALSLLAAKLGHPKAPKRIP